MLEKCNSHIYLNPSFRLYVLARTSIIHSILKSFFQKHMNLLTIYYNMIFSQQKGERELSYFNLVQYDLSFMNTLLCGSINNLALEIIRSPCSLFSFNPDFVILGSQSCGFITLPRNFQR